MLHDLVLLGPPHIELDFGKDIRMVHDEDNHLEDEHCWRIKGVNMHKGGSPCDTFGYEDQWGEVAAFFMKGRSRETLVALKGFDNLVNEEGVLALPLGAKIKHWVQSGRRHAFHELVIGWYDPENSERAISAVLVWGADRITYVEHENDLTLVEILEGTGLAHLGAVDIGNARDLLDGEKLWPREYNCDPLITVGRKGPNGICYIGTLLRYSTGEEAEEILDI